MKVPRFHECMTDCCTAEVKGTLTCLERLSLLQSKSYLQGREETVLQSRSVTERPSASTKRKKKKLLCALSLLISTKEMSVFEVAGRVVPPKASLVLFNAEWGREQKESEISVSLTSVR